MLGFISQGMAIKIIAAHLIMPICTLRVILKKFKATGTVTNLHGRRPMSLLENYRGKQHLGVIKSPKLPLEVTSMPTND